MKEEEDAVLEYLKETCCPYCMGKKVVKKTFEYEGCPNDNYSFVVYDKDGNRSWLKFPVMSEK